MNILPRTLTRRISICPRIVQERWKMNPKPYPTRDYSPPQPNGIFPYSKADLTPMDAGNDPSFYQTPRFVTHIDDNAILNLRKYYDETLPRSGRILDFCSSWISHYPPSLEQAAAEGKLEVVGTGMNQQELSKNPVLKIWTVQDLNENPIVMLPPQSTGTIDAATCVVSIDYLTQPVEVLESVRKVTRIDGMIHLIVSNRCFPTKAVSRWLRISEQERVQMVGDYLWWSGWRDIEIVTIVAGSWTSDPLWAVRGKNVEKE